MEREPNAFIPSIGQILFLVVFLAMTTSPVGDAMLADADTGYHVRAGEYVLEHREIPQYDIFSYHSPPIPWIAHEWLAEVAMAVAHRWAGLTGVVVFYAFLIALTYALLFRFLRDSDGNVVFDVLILLFVLASSILHWLARPHVFSLLLMVVWYGILEEHRRDRRNRLVFLPVIMLLWVNLHGGYLTGFILAGVYFLGTLVQSARAGEESRRTSLRKARHLAYVIVACLLVSLVNPYGYRILLFPFQLMNEPYIMNNVAEFLSPNFHSPMPFKYLLFLLIGLLAVSRKPLDFTGVVLVLVFLNMALVSARFIPLFAIVAAPVLSRQADALLADFRESRWASFLKLRGDRIASIDGSARGYVWPIAAMVGVALLVTTGRIEFGFNERIKPVAAVEFLKNAHIDGHMYNKDEFGDYLIYETYPEYEVFFDGRNDMYGAERLKEYHRIASLGSGWEELIEKYDIRWFFISSRSILTRYLQRSPDWRLIYSDDVADILVRNSEEYRALIDEYREKK